MVEKETLLEMQQKILDEAEKFATEIAPVYRILNWKWGIILAEDPFQYGEHVPGKKEILEQIIDLSTELVRIGIESDEDKASISTGGLCVYYEIEDGEYICGIKFVKDKCLYSEDVDE